MSDPTAVHDFLKEQVRIVRLRMDGVIRDIEEGLGRKRAKGEELAARSNGAVSMTDRIIDAIRDADEMEQIRAFIEQEVLGTP